MKKMIISILVALQLLSVSTAASAVSLTDAQKEDLYKLGIMTGDENGDLRLQDTITRAEAAKMICVAGNISPAASAAEHNIFPDVADHHWAYSYIRAAKEKKMVGGDDEGNFNPENSVTNEEIVKMLVCMLGYEPMAESFGGYPAGYKATAAQIGITKDLGLKEQSPAIRNDVAIMICHALDTPIMVKKSEGEQDEDGDVYVILDGEKGIPYSTIRGTRGMQWDTSRNHIHELAQAFAAQYPYKEGDTEKSFTLYPDIVYTSGLEETKDGVIYECPAIYDDTMAYELVSGIEAAPARLVIGDEDYEVSYATFNEKVLVPYDTMELIGCETAFDADTYVATIQNDEVTLEILPNVIGMRKNKAEGYWVPLEICARFINDVLYVPLEAVAREFNVAAALDADSKTITFGR